ncbi:SpvB/TcaC N-terminal domain-containing protein [Cupriavidus oxalaticus]|uniref:Uncharacterized protein n=1 Tax=Cupriavidus oxalaticus TaxID=96344 RepID=A0A4P7LKY3_9BURK|nr:SpvB/TcaC N-terminal domain-containing protein [Cupriavidus oxalaticus]QBY55459.1 hypothetical protein E0W60_30955 [Cupriavidus oxalaticus]
MTPGTAASETSGARETQRRVAPSISLPKGGGAIRGLSEKKLAVNPVTGTGSRSVPIATSPGLSGFGPPLSPICDSGAANGPIGLGWSLSFPSISRKSDQGLPQYLDAQESDVFLHSCAEDMVSVCRQDVDAIWVVAHPGCHPDPSGYWRDRTRCLIVHEDALGGYCVRRYRSRSDQRPAHRPRYRRVCGGVLQNAVRELRTWYMQRFAGALGKTSAMPRCGRWRMPTRPRPRISMRWLPLLTVARKKIHSPPAPIRTFWATSATVRGERKLPSANGLPSGAVERHIVMRYL